MNNRLIIPALALCTASLIAAGCGPTKAGLEARTEAKDRLAVMNARLNYDQAVRAFETGQLDRAMREITLAIDRVRAQELNAQGAQTLGAPGGRGAVSAHSPELAEYHLLEGRIHLEMHRLERALESFRAARTVRKDHAASHYFSGVVFQRWSNHERAYEHYKEASEIDPTNAQYLVAAAEALIATGDFVAAEQLVQPRLTYFEHNAAMRHLLAQIALLRDDPVTAVRLYSEARLLDSEDLIMLEELAWAQYAAGQYARCYDSVKLLQRLTGSAVARPDLLLIEARSLVHQHRLNEARNVYLELSRLDPGDVNVWMELGAVAWEIGDHRRVEQSGLRAVAVAPHRYEGYVLQALAARSAGRADEAATLLREATRRAPENALPHLLLGRALEEAGDIPEALAAYGRALHAEPHNREAHESFDRLSEGHALSVVR
jgi:tetratricopeptide (TPR) repeat protein